MGAPGSGKTTLAKVLAAELRLPCLHRDDFWIALLDARTGSALPPPTGEETTDAFVSAVGAVLDLGVSCIADDNFAARSPGTLDRLARSGRCVVLRTSCSDSALRFVHRIRTDPVANDPLILKAMGAETIEDVVESQGPGALALVEAVTSFSTAFPMLDVSTTAGYEPPVAGLIEFVRSHSR